ncbi:MAG: DUF4105 domain-containing protein [Rickettsiales bacterium]|nr:DUF4105 domain-containing protein [Rickettsiales bacterium]
MKYRYLFIFILLFTSSSGFAEYKFNWQKGEDVFFVSKTDEWKKLLHYHGNKSVVNDKRFFLAKNGNKNPYDELVALLNEYNAPTFNGENDVVCRFPARIRFVRKYFNLGDGMRGITCPQYEEFRQKVPADTISIAFAAENNFSPSSMMGHMFIKISGKNHGVLREHSFSFFATFEQSNGLWNYLKVLSNNVDGSYILSPYSDKISRYLGKEQRPIWEFDLNFTEEEKNILLEHMWELKEQTINYGFITHNCGTAAIDILQIARPNIIKDTKKHWHTPTEYVKMLLDDKNIDNISLIPSDEYRHKIEKYNEIKNITDISPSSKLSFSYRNFGDNYFTIDFRPIYLDLNDVNTIYYDDLETKLFSFRVQYNIDEHKLFVDNLTVWRITSIIDFLPDKIFSKYFNLSFENDLDKNKTELKPNVEIGMGIGFSLYKNLKVYFLPKFGYRHSGINNTYIIPEVGIVYQFDNKLKTILSYQNYIDNKHNNRGFDEKIAISGNYRIDEIYSLEIDFNRYYGTTTKHKNELMLKFGLAF